MASNILKKKLRGLSERAQAPVKDMIAQQSEQIDSVTSITNLNKASLDQLTIHIESLKELCNVLWHDIDALKQQWDMSRKNAKIDELLVNIKDEILYELPIELKSLDVIYSLLQKIQRYFLRQVKIYFRGESLPVLQEYFKTELYSSKYFLDSLLKNTKHQQVALLDPGAALLLLRNIVHLKVMRSRVHDSLLLCVPVVIDTDDSVEIQMYNDTLYLSDEYIRKQCHAAGFLDVLGPFMFYLDDAVQPSLSRRVDLNKFSYCDVNAEVWPNYKNLSFYICKRRSILGVQFGE